MNRKEELRREIDILDELIASLLNRRFEIVCELGEIKKQNGMPIRDIEREEIVISQAQELMKKECFKEPCACVFKQIIKESIKLQK